MLEQMRRSSQSLLIYVLFGIVIAVFVINFGPQSGSGCDAGVANNASFAAKVDGREISSQDYRYGYFLMGGGQAPAEIARARRLKETVMDRLIERELLAREAARMGFRVSDEEVEDFIAEAKIIALGFEQPLPFVQKEGKFDYELFRRFVLYQLGMTPRGFIEQQRREMLAQRVRQLLRGGANVSVDEIKTDFVRRGNQVNIEYVRFSVRKYEEEIEPTGPEIEAHAKANEAKLKELYESRKFLYEKAPKERKLRQILVKVDSGASADASEAAKKKAEALAARVRRGETFAAVAKAASEDNASQRRGGEIGWKRQGTTTLGAEMEGKLWAAKDAELVGPMKGADGWYLAVAEGTREGDIPFDAVKLDLAGEQLRGDRAKARAKADADAALVKAKAAQAKALKDVFPAPADKDKDPAKSKAQAKAKTPEAPAAEETGLFTRRGAVVEGIGTSPELAKAVFELTPEAPFAGPVEVAGSYIVVKLKERKQADMAEFENKRLDLMRQAAQAKGEEIVDEWALRRCQEAKDAKRIDVNRELLRYEAGPEGTVAYEPCTPPPPFRF